MKEGRKEGKKSVGQCISQLFSEKEVRNKEAINRKKKAKEPNKEGKKLQMK